MNMNIPRNPDGTFKTGINYNRLFNIPHPFGSEAYHWKGGKVELFCKNCRKLIRRHPSRIDREFCSQKCYGEYRSEHIEPWNKNLIINPERTDNNGVPANWRRIILNRDNFTCQFCNIRFLKEMLHIHHIIPFHIVKKHTIDNLITLCEFCHRNVH